MAKKILNFNHDISLSSRHRASFLACKEEIFEALENGWTAKTIWTKLHDAHAFDGSYNTFCRHIRHHIKQKSPIKEEVQTQIKVSPQSIKPTETSKLKPDSNPSPPRFEYNPNVTLDINDL